MTEIFRDPDPQPIYSRKAIRKKLRKGAIGSSQEWYDACYLAFQHNWTSEEILHILWWWNPFIIFLYTVIIFLVGTGLVKYFIGW